MRRKRVAVIGEIFADMLTDLVAYPQKGDRTYGTPLRRCGGGTGGNIAAGLGTLEVETSLICRLGDDETGHYLKADMEKYHVDPKGIVLDPNHASGAVIIAITPDGERTIMILANGSSYEKLTEQDLSYLDELQPDAVLISGTMIGVHPAQESVFKVIPRWKGRTKLYFDPNLCYPVDQVPADVKEAMQKFCELCDVILTGNSEMKALDLSPRPGQTFIVKCGGEGSFWMDENREILYRAAATKHPVADTTGAGDTYAAAFVCAELEGKSVEAAMEFASAAAGMSVAVRGARGMPRREEIDSYMKREEQK